MDSVVYSNGRRGGWVTFPFITGSVIGLTLGGAGWLLNLIVYLIQEFHINSIDPAQIFNFVNGCFNLIADSLLGSFSVILISSCLSLLGITILALTASLDSLRPQPCEMGSSLCKKPTNLQLAVLNSGIALATLGMGGTRFTSATMGANQFDKPQHRVTFFNWYFLAMYVSSVISATAIVYMEDNISWKLGFGICVAANLVGLVIFLLEEASISQNNESSTGEMQLELDDKYVTDDATMSLTGSVFQDVNADSMKIDILPEEVSIVQNDGKAIVEMQHELEMQQCH
ncbi:hypothetical protein Pint_32249 [Pistacia integerrima]|uniref:Uncharacterized protein n=1 Tax=Pistacia integerrima TaxID=434235 RepID=A0ACC0XPE7_9ROSI|nr:hypothetical protein Pint_32249 [Pistacia integerrima]